MPEGLDTLRAVRRVVTRWYIVIVYANYAALH